MIGPPAQEVAKMRRGFTIVEVLVASIILLLTGTALVVGFLEYTRQAMRAQTKRLAEEVASQVADYIKSLPYDHWLLNPQDPPGTPDWAKLYCHDCAFNRSFYYSDNRSFSGSACDQRNQNIQQRCSFLCPDWEILGQRPFDKDNDGIPSIFDPYHGPNDCQTDQPCQEPNKWQTPTWYLAGTLRVGPDWLTGTTYCRCLIGNCRTGFDNNSPEAQAEYIEPSGAGRTYNRLEFLPIRCTYSYTPIQTIWYYKPMTVYVGLTVINYADASVPVKHIGKAVGVVAWWFDPVDHRYRSITKLVMVPNPNPGGQQ